MWGLVVNFIRDEKVSAVLVVLLFLGSIKGYFWLDATFITKAEASEKREQIENKLSEKVEKVEQKVEVTNILLRTHIHEFDIINAINRVESLEAEKRSIELLESLGTETAQSKSNKEVNAEKLEHAKEYRDCLLQDKPNCSLLKERR